MNRVIYVIFYDFLHLQRVQVHPCCGTYQYFIPFYCCIIFHSMDVSQFFNLSVDGHCPHPRSVIMSNGAVNICVQVFMWVCISIPLGCIHLRMRLLGCCKGLLDFSQWPHCFLSPPAMDECSNFSMFSSTLTLSFWLKPIWWTWSGISSWYLYDFLI